MPQEDYSQEVLDVMRFDPFANGPDTEEQETDPSSEQSETDAPMSEPPDGGDAPEPGEGANGQQQVQTPPPGPSSDEVSQLRQELARMQQQIAAQHQAPQQGQGQGQHQGQRQQPEPPRYDLSIPDQLWDQMNSDDPHVRRQALQTYNAAVATHVHQRVQEELRNFVSQAVPSQVQQMIAANAAAQQVFSDFYGHYPHLNKPELRQLVVGTAQQVMRETGIRQWTPQLRDMVAQRVGQYIPAPQAPTNGQQAQAPAPKANRMTGSAPRSGGRDTDPNGERAIVDTLF